MISHLTPASAFDSSGNWLNASNAIGWPGDGLVAESAGTGLLILRNCSGPILNTGDVVVGFEVSLKAATAAGVLDSLTDTAGTLLRLHDGEKNADWQKPFTGADPSDLIINSSGRAYYGFQNSGGLTFNGGEHFLTLWNPGSADMWVEAVFYCASQADGEKLEIMARAAIPYRFYILSYTQTAKDSGKYELWSQTTAGNRTLLASYYGDGIATGQAATVRLECVGSNIRGFVNGVLRLSVTNTTITASGYAGVRSDPGSGRGGTAVIVAALYDLGSPTTITRFRRRIGTANGDSWPYVLEASADGVAWVNAFTGSFSPPPASGSFAWDSELDSTAVTATAYRFWRVVVLDASAGADARIADFRLYTASGIVVPGGPVVTKAYHAASVWEPETADYVFSSVFTDGSPGSTATWVGGALPGTPESEGLQLDKFKAGRIDTPNAEVFLTVNGTTAATPAKTVAFDSELQEYVLGGPSDLWAASWMASDVNTAAFGLMVRRAGMGDIVVDAARITLYHTNEGVNMAIRETGKQVTQLGKESALGGGAATNVRLRHARIQIQPNPEFGEHRPAGEKLVNHQIINREWSQGPVEGIATYDELPWLLSSVLSIPSAATLAVGAYRHAFHFDYRVRDSRNTFEIQYGDHYSRAHGAKGVVINTLGLDIRQDGVDLTGEIIGQKMTDNETLDNGAATVQTITQSGTGTFTLIFRGQETAALTAGGSLTATDIQTALRALPYVGGSTQLTVTGSAGGPFTVTFGNANSGPFKGIRQPIMGFRAASGTPSVAVAMTTKGGHTEYEGVPILPRHFEIYLSDTLAGLSSAKLSDAYVTGFSMGDVAAPVFSLDRAKESYGDLAEPSDFPITFNLTVQANAEGMGPLANARINDLMFMRILATGPAIGATGFNHRLQIDSPVKISSFGPFGDNQEVYAFEYAFTAAYDADTNTALTITVDNGVASY